MNVTDKKTQRWPSAIDHSSIQKTTSDPKSSSNRQGKDGDTNVRRRVAAISCHVGLQDKASKPLVRKRTLATAIKSPTPMADKNLLVSRQSTRRHDRTRAKMVTPTYTDSLLTWCTVLFADANAVEPCPGTNE